jgi:serine/threonine protein kinase
LAGYIAEIAIGKHIGNGHFGDVHLATDPVHGQVAVKIIAKKNTDTPEKWAADKAEFLAEAQNLASAAHPNIVPVYHLVQSPDGLSIQYCMKYCAGGSLQVAFDTGPSTLHTVRKVGTEVLLGLGALHARGMIHRDIKPANILLDETGVARIGDFGLVTDKLIFGYADKAGYSDHLAYEVWHQGITSTKTDIWAFGMTLYRLLHGDAWYKESNLPRLEIENGGFCQKLKWLPHIPQRWRRAIRSMMHDDPASRFQSVGQVQAAFSGLPTDPKWVCEINGPQVNWVRQQGSRTFRVEWNRTSQRKQSWRAWSEPTNGTGRNRALGGSGGEVGSVQANNDLTGFFKG